jgi:hypothetical protein
MRRLSFFEKRPLMESEVWIMKRTGAAISIATVAFNLFVFGCDKKPAPEIGGNRDIAGLRPDSLATSPSPGNTQAETNLARSNLPKTAHQDPAKTRRLLNTITENAPDRIARNKRNNELRQQRLQAIERQMQMQSREQ